MNYYLISESLLLETIENLKIYGDPKWTDKTVNELELLKPANRRDISHNGIKSTTEFYQEFDNNI